ncbi:MAG: hypothetical protein SGI77_05530 [Pirellulaceae bacterium]|nr:hypothetical protein [Pirellulaceae bacterium]
MIKHAQAPCVNSKRILNRASFWVLIAILHIPISLVASQTESSTDSDSGSRDRVESGAVPTIVEARLGVMGTWKIGHSTQASVILQGSKRDFEGRVEIETVDSDGVGVIYQTACQIKAGSTQTVRLIIRHGRSTRPIQVRLVDPTGRRLENRFIGEQERGTILPIGQPWVVGIGSNMQLDQAALRSVNGSLSSYTASEINDPTILPREAHGYRGIDLLVLSTLDLSIIRNIDVEQQNAIADWVRNGGHLQIWIGENAEQVRELDWIGSMLPVEVESVVKSVDPSLLESFLSSQKRLDKLTCSRLVPRQCVVDLSLQSKLPVLLRGAYGFGQVHICAFDLNSMSIQNWPDRKLLLEKLLNEHWETQRQSRSRSNEPLNYLGYDDLSGQARAALDVFSDVQTGGLTLLAVLLSLFVALLGPFDYFVVSKKWRRPAWTWLSLVLWSASAIGGVTLISHAWKPAHQTCNSIEIVDYDYATSTLRGRAFANLYSGRSGVFDVSLETRDLIPRSSEAERMKPQPNSIPTNRSELSWCGQPGHGLGGFDSSVRTDLGFPTYRIHRREKSLPDDFLIGPASNAVEIKDMGIAYAGTKSIRGEWNRSIENIEAGTHFSVTGASEALEGTWINPMNDDLFDGWLLYRGWVYALPSRVRPNGVVQISASDIPKDLARRLQRRQIVKDSDLSAPWDPGDHSDVERIVEMLTLHRAAGGTGYTGLGHRYWNDLDLSQHLRLNRAIVFGRLSKPMLDWSLTQSGTPLDIRDGRRAAFVRFVIPVTVEN